MNSISQVNEVDVGKTIDAAKVNTYLWSIVALCAMVSLLDGFDILAISYVAPVISVEWKMPREAFGPIFAAHYIGAAIGAVAFGRLADSYGRRLGVIFPTLMFGTFALLTCLSFDFWSLFSLRLLTGIGLGGALVNAIALVSEYSPGSARATLVSVMYAAFPLGGVLGGPLSAVLIGNFGWQSVFIAGGVLPLCLSALLWFTLPESARFLVLKGRPGEGIAAILRRVTSGEVLGPRALFVVSQTQQPLKSPIKALFSREFNRTTSLLSLAAFTNQFVVVYVVTWIPLTMQSIGMAVTQSIFASVAFSLGGVIGSLALAQLIDRRQSYSFLTLAFFASAAFVACIGIATSSWLFLLSIIAMSGLFAVGATIVLSAYASTAYPTAIRSTGVGWIIGAGRVGAIGGALFGTALIAAKFSLPVAYSIAAIPAVIGGIAMLLVRPQTEGAS